MMRPVRNLTTDSIEYIGTFEQVYVCFSLTLAGTGIMKFVKKSMFLGNSIFSWYFKEIQFVVTFRHEELHIGQFSAFTSQKFCTKILA